MLPEPTELMVAPCSESPTPLPLAAVPVSVVGSFAVLHALGFSINTLSLFGLVLAIGIVVDDAIVVVENVERHIARGLSPMEATKQAMREVRRPIIAITLVLCAVFIPVSFLGGLAGELYRCLLYTSPSPRDGLLSRMPSSA